MIKIMTDIVIPDYLLGILISLSLIAGILLIGILSGMQKNKEDSSYDISPIQHYNTGDWIATILGSVLIAAVFVYLLGVIQISPIIESLPSGVEKNGLRALVFSTYGLILSMFALVINFINEIPTSVKSRVHHRLLMEKLKNLEEKLDKR